MIFDAKEAFNRTLKALTKAEKEEIKRVMSSISEAILEGRYTLLMKVEERLSDRTIAILRDKGYFVEVTEVIDIYPRNCSCLNYAYEIRWDKPYTIKGES